MKRLLICLVLNALLLGAVGCNQTPAPTGTEETTSAPTAPEEPKAPKASDFSIVYAEDASAELRDAALALQGQIRDEYEAKLPINPEVPSAYEIALGGCREATNALKETLGVNSYAIKAIGTEQGFCIAVVGNNNRSTIAAINRFSALVKDTTWESILESNVTDSLDGYFYPENISFYGDSITSYAGISNNALYNSTLLNQRTWYGQSHMESTQTWWGLTYTGLGAKLCVNNAYSGDWAASEIALSRAENLHRDFGGKIVNPDTIVVYFGINDCGKQTGATFRENYKQIISAMQQAYPKATVFCCTLLGGYVYAGDRLKPFNTDIRAVAAELGVELIDLDRMIGQEFYSNIKNLTADAATDYLHPNKEGMKMMGDCVLSAIKAWYYGE